MTEQERKDARQLAERNAKRAAAEYGDSYYVVASDNTLKGYVAACDAKRAEIEKAVVQINHGDGYYSHHSVVLQRDHPGYDGLVIHVGDQVDNAKSEAGRD